MKSTPSVSKVLEKRTPISSSSQSPSRQAISDRVRTLIHVYESGEVDGKAELSPSRTNVGLKNVSDDVSDGLDHLMSKLSLKRDIAGNPFFQTKSEQEQQIRVVKERSLGQETEHSQLSDEEDESRVLSARSSSEGEEDVAPSQSLDFQEGELDDNQTCFLQPVKIVSWNMCHFTAIDTIPDMCKKAFQELLAIETPDVMILQELPKDEGPARIRRIKEWMGEHYQFATCENKQLVGYPNHTEHVFFWNTKTVVPFSKDDMFVEPLVNLGLKRPAGRMRFREIASGRALIISSVHLKSGGKEETIQEFNSLFANYNPRVYRTKNVERADNELHIIAGDFNTNPHTNTTKKQFPGWVATGSKTTQTSSGSRGYDFFFLLLPDKNMPNFFQHELPQRIPKNSNRRQKGVSDHDPIILTLWNYRN